jgi:hypothetical protein
MDINPFHILAVLPQPLLDLADLRKKYIDIQRNGHPDLGHSPETSELANQAYTRLKQDETRVADLLRFYGEWPLDINLIDMDFLSDAMDLGEEIDQIAEGNQELRGDLQRRLDAMRAELNGNLMQLNADLGEPTAQVFEPNWLRALSVWYQKSRYLTRLEKNIKGEQEL